MTAPPPSLHALLPRSRLPSGLVVQKESDRPDFPFREEILPLRHRRVPGRPLGGQPGTTLRDTPEDKALRQLRDRAVVLEVGGQRVEPGREMTQPIEMVPVAGETVPVKDPFAVCDEDGERVWEGPQRIL